MKGKKIYLKARSLHDKLYSQSKQLNFNEKTNLYNQYKSLIKKAAYLGNSDAQYDYAQLFESISYFDLNNPNYYPKKCIYWYTKACNQGHPAACNNLASFYENGEGIDKNLKKAFFLYKKSSDLGYSLGVENYNIMREQEWPK